MPKYNVVVLNGFGNPVNVSEVEASSSKDAESQMLNGYDSDGRRLPKSPASRAIASYRGDGDGGASDIRNDLPGPESKW